MLAEHTPAPIRGIVRSKFLDRMYKEGFLEVGRWSAYLPDDCILDIINGDRNLLLYAVNFNGVPMDTHGGSKSFFANIHQQSRQTPSYNTKAPSKKRRPNRKGSG